jgi:carboxyl-terminal processing protease
LDLRGTIGGSLADAIAFADVLLGDGETIVTARGRPSADSTAFVDHSPATRPDLPVVVLVDRGTAGAAEVVAGALQDHDRAVIVGETTFGRGVRHSFFPLGNGLSLRLTTEVWVTPSGRVIQRFEPPEIPEGSTDTVPERPKFRTGEGRTVLGGGGVVPDREIPVEREPSRSSDPALAVARQLLSRAATRKALIAALSVN